MCICGKSIKMNTKYKIQFCSFLEDGGTVMEERGECDERRKGYVRGL